MLVNHITGTCHDSGIHDDRKCAWWKAGIKKNHIIIQEHSGV